MFRLLKQILVVALIFLNQNYAEEECRDYEEHCKKITPGNQKTECRRSSRKRGECRKSCNLCNPICLGPYWRFLNGNGHETKGVCYRLLHQGAKTKDKAKEACTSVVVDGKKPYYLIQPRSAMEQHFITAFIAGGEDSDYFWVDAAKKNGKWNHLEYKNFENNTATNNAQECIRFNGNTGVWYNRDCNAGAFHSVLCEKRDLFPDGHWTNWGRYVKPSHANCGNIQDVEKDVESAALANGPGSLYPSLVMCGWALGAMYGFWNKQIATV